MSLEEAFKVGQTLVVENTIDKRVHDTEKLFEEGTSFFDIRELVGRHHNWYQDKPVTVLPDRKTGVKGRYSEKWEVKLTRVLEKCLVGEWLKKVEDGKFYLEEDYS